MIIYDHGRISVIAKTEGYLSMARAIKIHPYYIVDIPWQKKLSKSGRSNSYSYPTRCFIHPNGLFSLVNPPRHPNSARAPRAAIFVVIRAAALMRTEHVLPTPNPEHFAFLWCFVVKMVNFVTDCVYYLFSFERCEAFFRLLPRAAPVPVSSFVRAAVSRI